MSPSTKQRAAIADDFTGATDLAGNWAARGLRTIVILGQPDGLLADLPPHDALVVALKTRSIDAGEARAQVDAAGRSLVGGDYGQLYDKYCSTFDSTPRGNIGPIVETLIELTGAERVVVVPSFPDNGRTVYQGHLFVGDQLLHESPMKSHPLNPMWDSKVERLLEAQTDLPAATVPLDVVRRGPEALVERLDELTSQGRRLIVVDAVSNDDLAIIASATERDPLVSGGSGLALGLGAGSSTGTTLATIPGRRLVLSGSASAATQRQVAYAAGHIPVMQLDVAAFLADADGETARLIRWAAEQWERHGDETPVLIYSVGAPEDVASFPAGSGPEAVEAAFSTLAVDAAGHGVAEFIIAGGETSGAVLSALGVRVLEVGQQLTPGVSWLRGRSRADQTHNFVLKSGNFGAEDLFVHGWDELG